MLINDIVLRVNKKLAGEMFSYAQIRDYLDSVIDDINIQLGSIFPAFSELETSVSDYNYFPDRWIRQVVIPGAAWYFFVTDEEGISTATQFQYDYERGLFYMQRDYFALVPEEYQGTGDGSVELEEATSVGGLNVDGATIRP